MNAKTLGYLLIALALAAGGLRAQVEGQPEKEPSFDAAAASLMEQYEASKAELNALRERMKTDIVEQSREVSDLGAELAELRRVLQEKQRTFDGRAVQLTRLTGDIKRLQADSDYVSNLFTQYINEFESRLHIAEIKRHAEKIEAAKLVVEDRGKDIDEVFEVQTSTILMTIERLHEAVGGTIFEGAAADPEAGGEMKQGTFLLVGPVALFASGARGIVGTAEQRLGSLEPSAIGFTKPEDAKLAKELVAKGEGFFPVDPTMGNAHKIAATEETLYEHVKKGGAVMVPIFAMAGLALLIALYKWLTMAFIGRPSRRRIKRLHEAIAANDFVGAQQEAHNMKGPTGRMLAAGTEQLRQPPELIEEVMYENVLTTRLRLQGLLPFIAICAASAPLLGLLGTVTGIINTFKMITVFGSGDVKSLSGGISEALITTKFGLIVAIPSLLLHAFLSRKARGVVGQMEAAAVAFMNQVGKTPMARSKDERRRDIEAVGEANPKAVRKQVGAILKDLLGPVAEDDREEVERTRTQPIQNG